MRVIGFIGCLLNGHDVYPSESIVADVMRDKRNWLCKCHRCGLYIMHDGAISGQSVTITERMAYETRDELITEFDQLRRVYYTHRKENQ